MSYDQSLKELNNDIIQKKKNSFKGELSGYLTLRQVLTMEAYRKNLFNP